MNITYCANEKSDVTDSVNSSQVHNKLASTSKYYVEGRVIMMTDGGAVIQLLVLRESLL